MTTGHDDLGGDGLGLDSLLSEVDDATADAVRPLLLQLQTLARGPVPAPSAELAAQLAGNVMSLNSRRRFGRHGVIAGLATVGVLALGVGTAAAVSPEFRSGATDVITELVNSTPLGHHSSDNPGQSGSVDHGDAGGGSSGSDSRAHPTPTPSPSPSHPKHPGAGSITSRPTNARATNHPTPPAESAKH
jgi:hypothetical protein